MSKNFLLLPVLILGYFLLLSFNLLGQPLYLDEGLYIFWASLFSADSNLAYVSMQDGKTPLFIWIVGYLNTIFDNYLYTGRFVSVLSSTITLICSMLLGWKIIGKKGAIWVFILFVVCPFNILISRMAFVDSLMISFGTLSITSLFFAREFGLRRNYFISGLLAVFSGIFLGLGFLTKSTIRVYLVAEIFIIGTWIFAEIKSLMVNPKRGFLQILKSHHFKRLVFLMFAATIITAIYFEILGYLRFGAQRFWGMLSIKESDLTFSLREILMNITGQGAAHIYFENLPLFGEYFLVYFGTLLVFFLVGIYQILKRRLNLWLLILVFIFSTAVFLSAKIIASRYITIVIPFVLIISAVGVNKIWESNFKFKRLLSISLFILPAVFSGLLILSPLKAVYSSDDRSYFLESDLNLPEIEWISKYFSLKPEAVVGVEASWGVAEGLVTALNEQGVKTIILNRVIRKEPTEELTCKQGFIDDNKQCWKIDMGGLKDHFDKEIYLYMTVTEDRTRILNSTADIELIREFKRTGGGPSSYLYKFKGYRN